jgi:hypothetical protein
MSQYLTNTEETEIRKLIDEVAKEWELFTDQKETYHAGFYIDRLLYRIVEDRKIPLIAFEIEKSVPDNERIRKDIMNIVFSRAPMGYIILPHARILKDRDVDERSTWPNWYKNKFFETFQVYVNPFLFYCEICLVDADQFMNKRSLEKSIVYAKRSEVKEILKKGRSNK